MKKTISRLLTLVMILSLIIPSTLVFAADEKSKDIVILYTNDVHCEVKRSTDDAGVNTYSFGYANISAYKKALEETYENVLLVDAGDHIQGGVYGVLSEGEWMIDLMNAAQYDLATLGNHEFDYMIPQLKACMEKADFPYVSCNFIDLESQETVVYPYAVFTCGDKKVAFVGITTPETFTKSTPAYFKDENGNFKYTFCEGNDGIDLYTCVQATIDTVKEKEAPDYIIGLAHLGIDPASEPWTSEEVIAHTNGLDVVLDGHSHSTVPSEYVTDAKGNKVVLSQTGTKFASFGELTISEDGNISTQLIDSNAAAEQDPAVTAVIDEIVSSSSEILSEVAGTTDYALRVYNPETGKRIIRNSETNAGDFVADAYRAVSGADIASVNGGGIRVDIPAGDVTVEQLRNLHPFGNELCVKKTTGAHIADLLEAAVAKLSADGSTEAGGFQHVSGMTYEVDLSIPTGVVTNEQGEFVEVSGERRVFNIQVLNSETGEYEPLDLEKEYTIASHNYMLKSGGDGLSMFKDDELLIDGMMLDYQVVMTYFDLCGGSVPAEYEDYHGQGRIKLYSDAEEAAAARAAAAPAAEEAAEDELEALPQTGAVSAVVFYLAGASMMLCGGALTGKNRKYMNR